MEQKWKVTVPPELYLCRLYTLLYRGLIWGSFILAFGNLQKYPKYIVGMVLIIVNVSAAYSLWAARLSQSYCSAPDIGKASVFLSKDWKLISDEEICHIKNCHYTFS